MQQKSLLHFDRFWPCTERHQRCSVNPIFSTSNLTQRLASTGAERQPGHKASRMSPKTGSGVRTRLKTAISELQGLDELLLSADLVPHVLEDFREALNRVRNSAWAAQQYVAQKESGQSSTTVHSLLACLDQVHTVRPQSTHTFPR